MNSEYMHQLYGGEISDYSSPKLNKQQFEDPQETNTNLANIYDSQIKGKPSINTTGIFSANFGNIPRVRDPHFDVIDNQLRNTLNSIAKEIGLQSDAGSANVSTGLRNQTQADIEIANNNVIQALKELEQLKAI